MRVGPSNKTRDSPRGFGAYVVGSVMTAAAVIAFSYVYRSQEDLTILNTAKSQITRAQDYSFRVSEEQLDCRVDAELGLSIPNYNGFNAELQRKIRDFYRQSLHRDPEKERVLEPEFGQTVYMAKDLNGDHEFGDPVCGGIR